MLLGLDLFNNVGLKNNCKKFNNMKNTVSFGLKLKQLQHDTVSLKIHLIMWIRKKINALAEEAKVRHNGCCCC